MEVIPNINSRRAGLIARIKLIVRGDLTTGNYDPVLAESFSGCIPTRSAFQFSGADGVESAFPVEYVMRMMNDWAKGECNPYIKIQNTGVSVLIEGFFDPPINATKAPLCTDKVNVLLNTTESTGIVLSDINRIKQSIGVDCRPFQACLIVNCFVRLPIVQLAFRFVGPSDPGRTTKLLDSAIAAYDAKIRQRRKRNLQIMESKSQDHTSDGCIPIPIIDETHRSGITGESKSLFGMFKNIASGECVTTIRIPRYIVMLWIFSVLLAMVTWGSYRLYS